MEDEHTRQNVKLRTFYKDPKFRIKTPAGKSEDKRQNTGIRQGCPLSPYLFVIFMTVLFHDVEEEVGQKCMERTIVQKLKRFMVGQIAFCNGGCTMQLPTFYRVVKLTQKTVWLQELHSHLIEDDGYAQIGNKIPINQARGNVFQRRIRNWKDSGYEFQEYAYERYWGIIEPWDGLAKYYNCLD